MPVTTAELATGAVRPPETNPATATALHNVAGRDMQPRLDTPLLSVVVPVHNERDNMPALVAEIVAALRGVVDFEIVYVDDASADDTADALQALRAQVPELRVLRHAAQSGQSTAVRNGVKAARGAWIATLDGDGQNDPADIPQAAGRSATAPPPSVKLFAGWRVQPPGPRQQALGVAAGPTRSARACCATTRPTPAAASSCSSARRSSTCPTSTTCTATCRR